ncbi:sensor histidine kinase [Parvularcula lutaonensis]|uniref:histidine kinase n=1 Tax=Parvularcula lutaonensis TaxID=491923 RepID=A0ABV7MB34_9PROT|nr:histidine kinase dimerization/phospho-acceptor domain-containing protein [Parvularcula lutaonensis]GGY43371.1 hypothetical protein GCM10007148_10140 [Parvularcula lutaonensis]
MRRTIGTSGAGYLREYAKSYAARRALRLAQSEAAAAKLDAEQAKASKAAFLSGLNHELRTPLNHITGFTGMVRENPDLPAEKAKEYLDHVLQSAENLREQIDAILEAAAYAPRPVEERAPGTDPLPILRRLLQEHANALFVGRVEIDDELPATTLPSRDLYRALQRVFAAFCVDGGERRAVGLSVTSGGRHGSDVLITFQLLSGRAGLPLSVLRSLRTDLMRADLRLDEIELDDGPALVLALPGTVQEKAA